MVKFSLLVKNCSDKDLKLVVEPSADEYTLGANQDVLIHAQGPLKDPQTDRLQFDYSDRQITIYGWAHSSVRVDGPPNRPIFWTK